MATDYDAPRVRTEDEPQDDSIQALRESSQQGRRTRPVDDEANLHEDLELPGADLSHEELTITVTPRQAGEFTCTSCYLVKSRSLRSQHAGVCVDCT